MTSYTTRTTGQYRCVVSNEAGSTSSAVITVYGKVMLIAKSAGQAVKYVNS